MGSKCKNNNGLQALSRFPHFYETIQGVHLVEASPALRRIQKSVLSGEDSGEAQTEYVQRQDGIPVYWHDGIELVPGMHVNIKRLKQADALIP